MDRFFLIYVLAINMTAFVLMLADKRIAVANGNKRQQKSTNAKKTQTKYARIPEVTLLMVAFMLGAAGELLGMFAFRHKTKKLKFILLVPIFLVMNCVAVYFVLFGKM